MQKFIKYAATLCMIPIVVPIALAGEPVVLKNSGGVLLTREDGRCNLRVDSERNGLPARDLIDFACDDTGKPIAPAERVSPTAQTPHSPPAYYLDVEVMGYHQKAPVRVGSPIHLSQSIYFGYAGACTTRDDSAAVAGAIFAGKDGAAAAAVVQHEAEGRAPHRPGSDESVELKTDSFSYQIDLTPSAIADDGSVRLEVSGSARGPENFNWTEAAECNGFKPRILTEALAPTTLQMHGGGLLSDHLLGPIKFRVIKG